MKSSISGVVLSTWKSSISSLSGGFRKAPSPSRQSHGAFTPLSPRCFSGGFRKAPSPAASACSVFVVFFLLGFGAASVDAAPAARFRDGVVPILTKHGCNSGSCHGKTGGQNGFKLSLLGFEPQQDYESIVVESFDRRVVVASPRQSLLLLKATNVVPHVGGQRFEIGSDDYGVIERWIERGAPKPTAEDPVLQRIRVEPQSVVLAPGGGVQLRVTAYFSDGEVRDVTGHALYESNAPEIAEISEAGAVDASPSRCGVFAVMTRFGDKISVFRGTVPVGSFSQYTPEMERTAENSEIDASLLAAWKRLGVEPSPPVSDATFIRRATFDICGTLTTPEEMTSYVGDSRPDKRAQLIDRLLERPEYASFFALKWADILRNRGRGYGTKQQRKGTALFSSWIRESIEVNKPYSQFVAEILTASGSQERNPPTIWYRSVRNSVDYVESISQAFLGVRVQCAQCHHHPTERWSQADYYGLAAVFARLGRKDGFADAEVPTDETLYLKTHGHVVHPRTGEVVRPRPLGGASFEISRYQDPRRSLAQWLTASDNPFFAQAMANRLWGHFFGRGVIHPLDDFRSTNPPSNPELLDALARQFVATGYDVKALIRTICNSYAYSLSSEPTVTNKGDTQSFARFYPRRLSAEVLLDAMSQVLGVPTKFPGGAGEFPAGMRAIDLPDENVAVNFLDVFGRPARNKACECERVSAPSLHQALELVSSAEIQSKLTAQGGYVARLASATSAGGDNVRQIFLRTLARPPQPEELKAAVEFLESEEDRASGYGTLLWSLLATNEFLFNF